MSSYPQSAGHAPLARECRVCVLQTVWKGLFGAAPWLIFILTVGALPVCFRLARHRTDRRSSAVGVLGIFLATSSIAQFWAVMLTEGASDLIKHMALANFMTALLFVIALYAAFLLLTSDPPGSAAPVPTAEDPQRAGPTAALERIPVAVAADRARDSVSEFEEMLDRRRRAREAGHGQVQAVGVEDGPAVQPGDRHAGAPGQRDLAQRPLATSDGQDGVHGSH